MKRCRKLILAVLVCLVFYGPPVLAAAPVKLFGVVLLQQETVLQERAGDAKVLADYITQLQSAIGTAVNQYPQRTPASGFVAVAVKPGNKSNAWVDFTPPLPPALSAQIVEAVRGVPPLQVRDGVVVFAIKFGFWGANGPDAMAPAPAEWKAAAQKAGKPLEIGQLVETIWPE